jgi:hypothetical protein
MSLLDVGWAGLLGVDEAELIGAELLKSAKLRRIWQVRSRRKRYPPAEIARKAFPEDPEAGAAHINAQLRRRRDYGSEEEAAEKRSARARKAAATKQENRASGPIAETP